MYAVNAYNKGLSQTTILINAGADVNAKDNKGRTALMYAVDNKEEELVDLLIKNKVNVNAKDNNGETALGYAYYDIYDWSLNPYIVKSLIRAGANINEVFKRSGNTALLYAIYTYTYQSLWEDETRTLPTTFEVIKLLINNGANVNIRNEEGETPLSLSEGYPEINKLLKNSGAYLQ